jgi:hypothetical protein
LREIRDLLFNPVETGRLIDECAAIVYKSGAPSIVDADRMKWDYHPIMASGHAMSGKAGQGLFYQGARGRDFAGMVAQMKDYVNQRAAYIDRSLLTDRGIPSKPAVAYTGPPGFPLNRLTFKASAERKSTITETEWRVGRVDKEPVAGPGHYEITALWQSSEAMFRDTAAVPAETLRDGGAYRVRCRVKDSEGRWSHWSDPVEFATASVR